MKISIQSRASGQNTSCLKQGAKTKSFCAQFVASSPPMDRKLEPTLPRGISLRNKADKFSFHACTVFIDIFHLQDIFTMSK